jgi:transcriptional antiterminator NusG
MAETKKWYAVRTQNNREKYVIERIKAETSRNNITNLLGRYIIPTEKIFSIKNGKKIPKERTLYPGYLFLETASVAEMNIILKDIKGAAGFVKSRTGEISPLSEEEMSSMLKTQKENDEITAETSVLAVGEQVKVIDGAFSTFKGTISNVDEARKKLKVEISIFNRITSVDLDFLQVERIN